MRRVKIVATLGPSLDDPEALHGAIAAGVDVVRLNFSHGTQEEQARRLDMVRSTAERLGRTVGCLADLQGPKIRLGRLPQAGVEVPTDSEVLLQPGRDDLDPSATAAVTALPVTYADLAHDVTPGAQILIADGSLRLRATRVDDAGVWASVEVGGVALSHKGVNLPGVAVSAPSLTDKDIDDLTAALEMGVDWVALSFVRRPEDVHATREVIRAHGGRTPVIAKLERPEAIDELSGIVEAADAVMVARGDLGVEVGPERVPAMQKEIIYRANAAGRPVITATEMLESMITAPRPTRAEASDVANAVFDGTDAVMLSGETAVGRYPVRTIETMGRIVESAEASRHLVHPRGRWQGIDGDRLVARVVAEAAVQVAQDVEAHALVVYSLSGASMQIVSSFRPDVPLVGLTPHVDTRRRATLLWGTESVLVPVEHEVADLYAAAEQALIAGGWAAEGDRIVVVAGRPGGAGSTNRIMVHRIGDDVSVTH